MSVLDDQRRLTRTFEACHVAGAAPGPGQDNWLQTHFVERRGAQRAHIRLHFSVRACSSLGVAGGTVLKMRARETGKERKGSQSMKGGNMGRLRVEAADWTRMWRVWGAEARGLGSQTRGRKGRRKRLKKLRSGLSAL